MKSFLGVLITAAALLFTAVTFAADLSHSPNKFGVLEDPDLKGYYTDCNSGSPYPGTVHYFSISGCTASPCTVYRGYYHYIRANVTCGTKALRFTGTAHAIFLGFYEYELFNGAEKTGASCDKGGMAYIEFEFYITPDTPPGKYYIRIDSYGYDDYGKANHEVCLAGQAVVG